MTTFRRFCCKDLLRLGQINLRSSTEIRDMEFYMNNMAMWPSICHVAEAPGGRIMGYIMGCTTGMGEDCTGEITVMALPKDSTGLAEKLSNLLEDCCDKIYNCYRMVLYVHVDQIYGIDACQKLGYNMYLLHRNCVEMNKPLRLASRPPKNDCKCGCVNIPQESRMLVESLHTEGVMRS